jgi:hypothetical protein
MAAVDRDGTQLEPPGATGHSWQRPRPLRRPMLPGGMPVEPDDPAAQD